MTAGTGYDLTRSGNWPPADTFAVERARTIAYAAATNDPIRQRRDGDYAPTVFAVVPIMVLMADAAISVVPDALMLPILHGEHDFRFHRSTEPGETLRVRARPIGIEGKPAGVVVTSPIETRGIDGDLVNEQYFVGFFRGGGFDGARRRAEPAHAFDEELRGRTAYFTVAQTFRYAEPAGDPMPIYLDDESGAPCLTKSVVPMANRPLSAIDSKATAEPPPRRWRPTARGCWSTWRSSTIVPRHRHTPARSGDDMADVDTSGRISPGRLTRLQWFLAACTTVGFLVPNAMVIAYFAENDTSPSSYLAAWTASLPSTQLLVDLAIVVLAFLGWALLEARKLRLLPWWYLSVALTFLVGICCAVPLFLLVRDLRTQPGRTAATAA